MRDARSRPTLSIEVTSTVSPKEQHGGGDGERRRISRVFHAVDDVGNRYEILEESDHAEGEVIYYTRQGLPARRLTAKSFEILAPDLLEGYRTFAVAVEDEP